MEDFNTKHRIWRVDVNTYVMVTYSTATEILSTKTYSAIVYYRLIQHEHNNTEQVVENNYLNEQAERTLDAVHAGRSCDQPGRCHWLTWMRIVFKLTVFEYLLPKIVLFAITKRCGGLWQEVKFLLECSRNWNSDV